jgi:hypothetical protein
MGEARVSKELEIAGAGSIGGWLRWRKKHAIEPGTPCKTCETVLQGPYCHNCGQLAEDFHRSIGHLVVEAFESFFHFDGRLWQTLPGLVLRPGLLTREYLDGKRALQIPPLRLFLVLLLVAFFVGHCAPKNERTHIRTATPGEKQAAFERLQKKGVPVPSGVDGLEVDVKRADPQAQARADALSDLQKEGVIIPGAAKDGSGGFAFDVFKDKARNEAFARYLETRIEAVQEDPERFGLILEVWAHRVAILALPLSALMLTVLFAFQRRFYIYDHLIFSMHSLSFQLLLLTAILATAAVTGGASWWLALIAPVHLFLHMRGVYATTVFGTVLRMVLLFAGTVFWFGLLALLWLFLGFNAMAGH